MAAQFAGGEDIKVFCFFSSEKKILAQLTVFVELLAGETESPPAINAALARAGLGPCFAR
jgi:hypothetical protein